MIERPPIKISAIPEERNRRLEKVSFSNGNECLPCQLKKTRKNEHKYGIPGSIASDRKKNYWLITGLLVDDCLKKKEPSKVDIIDFLLFM